MIALAVALALLASSPRRTVEAFDQSLNRRPSATESLRLWCAERGIADPAIIRAQREATDDLAGPEIRRLLHAAPGEPVRHRRVRLTCGDTTLSRADNWYRPGRLTAEMNRRLEETDTPFGVVVAPLGFSRRTLVDRIAGRPSRGPDAVVLIHRAVLSTPDGTPLSVVEERYTGALLTGTAPVRPGR